MAFISSRSPMTAQLGWHKRHATAKHQQWFLALADVHQITQSWIAELQLERPSHSMGRGLTKEAAENLWMLEAVGDGPLDALLDDTRPEDVLMRLERTIWSVQAWTLMKLLERTAEGEKTALASMLQQIAWRVGRKAGETRWAGLPRESREDMRAIFLTLNDSPFTGSRDRTTLDAFLIRRAVSDGLELELLNCPHQIAFAEVKPVADELCQIHSHFLRGFIYVVNSKVSIESLPPGPRCGQNWFFVS